MKKETGSCADIPDLIHCSAFGETLEEALSEAIKAKDAWIESARNIRVKNQKKSRSV
jgi:predicted RNase H-like HicB family nuclease